MSSYFRDTINASSVQWGPTNIYYKQLFENDLFHSTLYENLFNKKKHSCFPAASIHLQTWWTWTCLNDYDVHSCPTHPYIHIPSNRTVLRYDTNPRHTTYTFGYNFYGIEKRRFLYTHSLSIFVSVNAFDCPLILRDQTRFKYLNVVRATFLKYKYTYILHIEWVRVRICVDNRTKWIACDGVL